MAAQYCDAEGCATEAQWVCSGSSDGAKPNYLCQDHYDSLRLRKPQEAECYIVLSDGEQGPALGSPTERERKV